jgi:DNA-binding CsgD family transcriptional regulator
MADVDGADSGVGSLDSMAISLRTAGRSRYWESGTKGGTVGGSQASGTSGVGVAVAEAWRLHGHFGQGRALLTELAVLPGAGQATLARANLCHMGALLAYLQGDLSASRSHAEKCVVISRALGNSFGLARGLGRMATVARAQGHFQEARASLQEGFEACIGPENEGVAANLSVQLALVARDENKYEEAGVLARTALKVATTRGFTRVAAHALLILGDAAAHLGETAEAKRYLDKSVALWTAASDRWGQARAMLELGRMAIDSGEHAAAACVITESLTIHRELADAWGTALALETSAALAVRTARPALALQLAEAAVELRRKADLPRSPRDSSWLAERLTVAERTLGPTRCTVARAKGRELTMEDAIDLALRVEGAGRSAVLTRRERDVAGLVALGWTDSQIARQLVVGRRTIESHMSTIRSKLGFNSRAQVAVWAVEKGLRIAAAPAGTR